MTLRLLFFFIFSIKLLSAYSVQNVLLLNSYHTGFSWTDQITQGVTTVFEPRDDINLYVEYLDSKRFFGSSSFSSFKNYLLKKYNQLEFQIIITSDNNALDFIVNNSIDKLWNVPVVFCGIANYKDYDIEQKKIFGVLETDDFYPIVKSILEIHNYDLDTFYFIVENSVTGKIRNKNLLETTKRLNSQIEIISIENYDFNSLIKQVRQISGKSVIYYPGIGRDYLDHSLNPEKVGIALAENAHVPLYSTYSNIIGKGAIGGYVRSGTIQGTESARIALKLIDNVNTSEIPKITMPQGDFIYDYAIIKKFGIDQKNLPKGSIVINKPEPIFLSYRKEVIFITVLIITLFVIIIFLVLSVYRRIKAERTYRESERRFRELTELLPQTVYECDLKGNFTFANNHGIESFGYTKDEFQKGINIFQVFVQEDHKHIKDYFKNLIYKEKPINETFTAKRKDNSTFPCEVYSDLIFDGDTPVGIRGICINVTKQKDFEKELIKSRKKAEESDELKSAFLANMSHEIRTPLNSIIGFSYLLAEEKISQEDIKKLAVYIKNSSDHLLMLINDIIDISKIEAGQLEIDVNEINVNHMLKEIYEYLMSERLRNQKDHITVNLKKQGKHNPVIYSDLLRLKQILLNLVNNALKFTEKGSITLGYETNNSTITFYVCDTGIGISNHQNDKVFDRFTKISSYKRKIYPGFGLGLSISKQLSQLLRGDLWFEKNTKKGTTFYLSIPLNIS